MGLATTSPSCFSARELYLSAWCLYAFITPSIMPSTTHTRSRRPTYYTINATGGTGPMLRSLTRRTGPWGGGASSIISSGSSRGGGYLLPSQSLSSSTTTSSISGTSSSSRGSFLLLSSRSFSSTTPTKKNDKHAPPPLSSITHPHPRINRLLREYLAKMEEGPPTSNSLQPPGQAQQKLPRKDRIFVNNAINLGKVDVLGWDYDYTLVSYTDKMEGLIYSMAKDYLVENSGYPAEIKTRRTYDPHFAIRGLAVDMDRGWLLKLSYINQIALRTVFNGRKRLTKQEVLAEYGDTAHVSPQYRNEHMKPLLDLFALSEACLLADVLDYLNEQNIHHDRRAVIEDVLKAINYVHTSGNMHKEVVKDPPTYMMPSPHLRETLTRFRDVGKKLFLCSNSDYEYVSGGLKFLIGEDWQDFFDVVIVSAGKPGFYTSDRPFRQVSRSTGKIRWTEVTKLEKGKVYSHGSLDGLTKLTGWKGPRVLYIGDQIWADLVGARRNQGWRTGAVIRELDHELLVQQSKKYRAHAHKVITVTELLRLVQEEMEKIRGEATAAAAKEKVAQGGKVGGAVPYLLQEADVRVSDGLETFLRHLQTEMSKMFNTNFGSVFRAEGEPTLFAFSLRRYADLYLSKLENFRFYSPMHRFYPQRGISMPHDPYIPAIIRPPPSLGEEERSAGREGVEESKGAEEGN